MIDFLDNFINYLSNAGWEKILRVFWFFFIFEFFRFFIVDFTMLVIWRLKENSRKQKIAAARKLLWEAQPLLSIIVPGKNEGKHLYKLVKSLEEQTYQNFELIVVDDGSDDQTEIIGRTLHHNGLIKYFFRNDVRGGKASAANLGLRYAKGEFVIHLDADCSYDRDAIENIIVPFYMNQKIGAVGGNVQVRNFRDSLCATLQAVEYTDTISIGRIATSELGIYRVISGAFGAFRKKALDRVGGWDIGPGLDGDITVKVRKLNYKIHFEPTAVCQTSVPVTYKALIRQRLRWDKSLIRFRLRKHNDVFFPTRSFKFSNFFSFLENVTYNLILNIKWIFYIIDMAVNFTSYLWFIIPMNLFMYTCNNYLKYFVFSFFRDRKNEAVGYFLVYLPCMVFYFGYFLRVVRSIAYFQEIFYRASYNDPWNPQKSSIHAKLLKI